jgi:hypothetical protein
MLQNYADFLGLESESILLQYAEAIQSRFQAQQEKEEVAQENTADNGEGVEAQGEAEESSESLTEQDENKDPVINLDKLVSDHDDGLAAAKPEKGNGSEALKENLSAKAEVQKESAPTTSA